VKVLSPEFKVLSPQPTVHSRKDEVSGLIELTLDCGLRTVDFRLFLIC